MKEKFAKVLVALKLKKEPKKKRRPLNVFSINGTERFEVAKLIDNMHRDKKDFGAFTEARLRFWSRVGQLFPETAEFGSFYTYEVYRNRIEIRETSYPEYEEE